MFIDPAKLYLLVIGAIFALIYFIFQLALCKRASKTVVKLIPVFINSIGVVLAVIYGFGLFGVNEGDGWEELINFFFTLVIGTATLMGYIGIGIAWLVYTFTKKK